MAEGAKVRVVRCPRCEKLLPELPNFTVYQCGSCGAALQAKKRTLATTGSSPANSNDGMNVESPESSSEKKTVVVSSVISPTAADSKRTEDALEKPLHDSNGGLRSDGDDVLNEASKSKLEDTSVEKATECINGIYRCSSKAPVTELKSSVDEFDKNVVGEEDTKIQFGFTHYPEEDHQVLEKGRGAALRRALRARAEGSRHSPYPDEGPSNYYSHITRVSDPTKKHNVGMPNGLRHLEQDRAELLRKLDDLRDKLRRSGEAAKPLRDETTANNRTLGRRDGVCGHTWFPEELSSSLNRTSSRHSHYRYGHNAEVPNFNPAALVHHDVPVRCEPFIQQMVGRAPCQHPAHCPGRPLDNYLYGQFDPDPFISYHHDGLYPQAPCSCVHCSTKHLPMPAHASYADPRVSYFLNSHGYHPPRNFPARGSRMHNQSMNNTRSHSHEQRHQQRVAAVKRGGRSCLPVAGAAPFVVCYNCFELLQLPHNPSPTVHSKHKLRCGSCSQIVYFELDGKRLIISSPTEHSNVMSEMYNNFNDRILESSPSVLHSKRHPVISYSNEYDNQDIPTTDEKLVLPSAFSILSNDVVEKEYGLQLSESEKAEGIPSSSSASENVQSPDSIICQRGILSSVEVQLRIEDMSQVPSVPLREHLGPPLSNHIIDGPGKGSRSKRCDQEKILYANGHFKQNSVKDVPVATEMDVPADEFPNGGFSQDSWDENKEEDQSRTNKGGESFLAGFIKKSFRDFSRFNSQESGKSKVSINGQAISDRVIKKAEKQAGTIHPGDYWYDYRAGFWGVMGHACLGIIPPFIEDFNFPMAKNCAGGNTGVFVNGRELHMRDLDLLAGRGLPMTRGRSYIIEISGKVWDEDTGEELDSLGKLAPTVEKVKHGFGMRAPKIMI